MPQISDRLLRALESDDPCDLQNLVQEKRTEDFEALQALLSREPSVNADHRRKAVYALGRWGDPATVPAIRDLLPDLDEQGRIAAADALGKLGTQEALEGVVSLVGDSSPQVRKFAARALGKIDLPEAQDKLREIETSDDADFVRAAASRQLKSGDQ